MGHGCHDCGVPNGCECPGSHGDWYRQRFELKATTLEFTDWHHQYWLAKANAKHYTKVAQLAAALPIDVEADRRVSAMLKKSREKDGPPRKLVALSDEDLDLIEWNLKACREDHEFYTKTVGDPQSWHANVQESVEMMERSIAMFERLLRKYGRIQ